MNNESTFQQAQAFLNERSTELDRKRDQISHARLSTENELEKAGFEHRLHDIEVERQIVLRIQDAFQRDKGLTLDTVILNEIQIYQGRTAHFSHGWQTGHEIPHEYWESQTIVAYLKGLLGRYHAWIQGRPYYGAASEEHVTTRPIQVEKSNGAGENADEHNSQQKEAKQENGKNRKSLYPWFTMAAPNGTAQQSQKRMPEEHSVAKNEALYRAIFGAFKAAGLPEGHISVALETPDMVVLIGTVHTEDERDAAIDCALNTHGVHEVVAGLEVRDALHCPVCVPVAQVGDLNN